MVRRYKQRTKSSRARISRALANNTKGGSGKIKSRPGYKTHVGKTKKGKKKKSSSSGWLGFFE